MNGSMGPVIFFSLVSIVIALIQFIRYKIKTKTYTMSTSATIIRQDGSAPNYNVRWLYSYEVDGTRYEGRGELSYGLPLRAGDRVEIKYDPADPTRQTCTAARILIGDGAAAPDESLRRKPFTEQTLASVTQMNVSSMLRSQIIFTYRANGTAYEGAEFIHRAYKLSAGDLLEVLYNPGKPEAFKTRFGKGKAVPVKTPDADSAPERLP